MKNKDVRLSWFHGIPYNLKRKTLNLMDRHCLGLSDAFEIVARENSVKGSKLWAAWYWCDFREFIPMAYRPQFLDFNKYPLSYTEISPGVWGLNPAAVSDYV